MPTIRANGLDIGYDVLGAGPPLVLLHGATSLGAEDFAAQLPVLSKAFLVHLPDARGHGRTRWDAANGFSYDWLVDDLTAFADGLGLDSFHLLGFSMGAMTALQFGAAIPGTAPDARRRRDHDAARAAGERGPAAHGPDPDPR